jgi:hypothetical protein
MLFPKYSFISKIILVNGLEIIPAKMDTHISIYSVYDSEYGLGCIKNGMFRKLGENINVTIKETTIFPVSSILFIEG